MCVICRISLFCTTLFCFIGNSFSQQANQSEKEILAFEQADQVSPPIKGGFLFTGSSSIRLWGDLAERFPDKKVINRGFGGSHLSDLVLYFDRVIRAYQPGTLIVYSGENDIASGKSATQLLEDFKKLTGLIRQHLPETRFIYISMKPSPSRVDKMEQIQKANQLISKYMRKKKIGSFVDVYTPMLNKESKPRPELFIADQLHMNKQGYDIWQQTLDPYLK